MCSLIFGQIMFFMTVIFFRITDCVFQKEVGDCRSYMSYIQKAMWAVIGPYS